MPRPKAMLPIDAVLRIRDLYAERAPQRSQYHVPQPRYSQAEIAKIMDTSETTVFRVVNRLGAYAFMGGDSLGEVKADPRKDAETAAAAKASLERLNKLLADSPPVDDLPDPSATLDPEMEAKVAAIRAQIAASDAGISPDRVAAAMAENLGNSGSKPVSNTHTSGNSARRETEAQDDSNPDGKPSA